MPRPYESPAVSSSPLPTQDCECGATDGPHLPWCWDRGGPDLSYDEDVDFDLDDIPEEF